MKPKIVNPEEVREMPEGLTEQTGACRFCGQMKMFHLNMPWSDEKLNEAATRECDCDAAKAYVRRMEAKEKAEKAIERLFGEASRLWIKYRVKLDETLKEYLLEGVALISDGVAYSFTIDEGRVKIRLAMTQSGDIKVKWTYTDTEEEKS